MNHNAIQMHFAIAELTSAWRHLDMEISACFLKRLQGGLHLTEYRSYDYFNFYSSLYQKEQINTYGRGRGA